MTPGEPLRGPGSFSRHERSKMSATDVAALVRDVTKALQFDCEAAGVQLRCLLAASHPVVLADELELKQALVHLCRNAIEAMPEGGTLTLEAVEVREHVELRVSDTGVGIPKDVDVFALGSTTKKGRRGRGLFAVKQIVSRHGGSIWVETDLGPGTTFLLVFPLAEGDFSV